LRLDVHGMAVVMLGQTIWFILVGSQLYTFADNLRTEDLHHDTA